MKRSLWIAVLLSLFMFQSLWNVAAAFCTHETAPSVTTSVYHFGHHADTVSSHKQLAHNNNVDDKKLEHTSNYPVIADHHDHILSCHGVLVDVQKSAVEPKNIGYLTEPKYDWHNLYQSVPLKPLDPPPLSLPL